MIIWLASYPRSGNTFLRIILNNQFNLKTYSIYGDKTDIAKCETTSSIVGHQELPLDFDLQIARSSDELYVIKTHDFIGENEDRVIYLYRDGRASTVSYFHYLNTFGKRSWTFKEVIGGLAPFGTWGDHLHNWAFDKRKYTLALRFEDITSDPQKFISMISSFIDCKPIATTSPTFEELHSINPLFFRKGVPQSWQSELTGDDLEAFWLVNYAEMKKYFPTADSPFSRQLSGNSIEDHELEILCLTTRNLLFGLAKKQKSTIQNLYELNEQIDSLKEKLNTSNYSLSNIQRANYQLTKIKAISDPFLKYKKYKELLNTIIHSQRN